jgi:transaldolase/glucose-6-phosphate isomerase
MNPLKTLEAQGQSIWLDYIRRTLLTSGELKTLTEQDGLSGMTSNPTIFEKAIGGSTDYDSSLRSAIAANSSVTADALFWRLAVEDIQKATDILRPAYEKAGGADGFVSLEVSPTLAHDTEGSIREARRLWSEVNRPNLMIKIPATAEGIPAIEMLLSEGINVNITLMFSMAHYEAVANAYLHGAARCAHPERLGSVASFFVSRVDTMVDPMLEKLGKPEALALRGKIAIANSRNVYRRFLEIFHGEPFAALRARGTRPQRVLWASTSTKNPAYRDVMYVEELIGPETVNTLPPATLKDFRDHGQVRGATINEGAAEAPVLLAQLESLGIHMTDVTARLQDEGVASFTESFEKLMATIESKKHTLLATAADPETANLGSLSAKVDGRLRAWEAAKFGKRMCEKDETLWVSKPTPEITDRLGWLQLPSAMQAHAADLTAFREQVKAEGFTHAVLLGMGGSSLAPEVFEFTFGNAGGYPELIVLDSTHPQSVRAVEARINLDHTLFIVSSKSGTTTEMLSFFYYFWHAVSSRSRTPGRQFIAVTDLGTPLGKLGAERGFRRVFEATPDVGGRYSALTHFGLVPAAVIGVNIHHLLKSAAIMQDACASSVAAAQNPGLVLGAALGEAALAGRDKVSFFTSAGIAALPTWLEQLIAESTGKEGRGIVPVAGEPAGPVSVYGNDRLFVHLGLAAASDPVAGTVAALEAIGHPVVRIEMKELADIGQEFFRWEVAIAAAGAVIGIQPFNQPDVQLAKDLAREAMQAHGGAEPAGLAAPVSFTDEPALLKAAAAWLASANAGDYFGIDAYIAQRPEVTAALDQLRVALRDRKHLATMLGYGPRFLHSTGQLHKGGPNIGVFLQMIDDPSPDLAVPETDYTFGQLIKAQALGDLTALTQRGRRTMRVKLGKDTAAEILRLAEVFRA